MTNLFGEEFEYEDIPDKPKGRRKTPTMQELYGTLPDKTCKTCKHNIMEGRDRKTWHKCLLWLEFFEGHSEASDIRNKWVACKKYEEGVNTYGRKKV